MKFIEDKLKEFDKAILYWPNYECLRYFIYKALTECREETIREIIKEMPKFPSGINVVADSIDKSIMKFLNQKLKE